MYVIFLFPLCLSCASLAYFLIADMDWKWKIFALVLVIASVTMQFAFPAQVHFLIPLGMQLFVCGWGWFHSQLA